MEDPLNLDGYVHLLREIFTDSRAGRCFVDRAPSRYQPSAISEDKRDLVISVVGMGQYGNWMDWYTRVEPDPAEPQAADELRFLGSRYRLVRALDPYTHSQEGHWGRPILDRQLEDRAFLNSLQKIVRVKPPRKHRVQSFIGRTSSWDRR